MRDVDDDDNDDNNENIIQNINNENSEKKDENNINNIIINEENQISNQNIVKEDSVTPLPNIDRIQSTESLIKQKIINLKKKFEFSIKYEEIMINILKYFDETIYEKINNSISETQNFLLFFKNSSEFYSKISKQIISSNNILSIKVKGPKMDNNVFLQNIMANTQNLLSKNFENISKSLSKNILSKGPFPKFNEDKSKIENIRKMQLKKEKEIENIKKSLQKKYNKQYEKLFLIFTNENNNVPLILVDIQDFVYIINDFLNEINKLVLSVNLFVVDTKDSLYEINKIYVQMNSLIKEAVLIYINESKKVFNIDVSKNFAEIENYYKELEKKDLDFTFKLENIFNKDEMKNNINTKLEQYYNLLKNSEGRVNIDKINHKNNFSINFYPNLQLFYEWLISTNPQPDALDYNDLIEKKFNIKRHLGFFSGWGNCVMILTKQKHLMIFDKSIAPENLVKIFEMGKISFRKSNDPKIPCLFDLIVIMKGKQMNFTGAFSYDAMNLDNLNNIESLVLSE